MGLRLDGEAMIEVMKILVDAEMRMFKGLNVRPVISCTLELRNMKVH